MSRAFTADKILENKTVGKLLAVTLRLFVYVRLLLMELQGLMKNLEANSISKEHRPATLLKKDSDTGAC